MESKHTPGPWKASPFSSVVGCPISAQPDKTKNSVLVAGTRSAVAEDPAGFRAEVEANARLIAAAPDMLEALMEAPIPSKYHGNKGFDIDQFLADYAVFSQMKRDAIAVARGEI